MLRQHLLLAALLFVGCGPSQEQEEEYRAALPTRMMLEAGIPEPNSQGWVSQGQASEFLAQTHEVLLKMNRGTQEIAALLETVSAQPPTSLTSETVVWGPYDEASSGNTWKLTVAKRSQGSAYQYYLDVRPKDSPDSAFTNILSGHHSAAIHSGNSVRGLGTGGFYLFNWDALRTRPEHDDGSPDLIGVQYGRSDHGSATVSVDFKGSNERYHYSFTPSLGHQLYFKRLSDMYEPGDTRKPESLSIMSRWRPDGAGRADVRISGGDLPEGATYSECWDGQFASRYAHASYDSRMDYGTEATDCAFTSASYPLE